MPTSSSPQAPATGTATRTESGALLDARGLALSYHRDDAPDNPVLAGFSLMLDAGETVAVLGPSGIGKSSLLRVLAGLQAPDRGEVRVHGRVLAGPHPRLSLVFQDSCLLPWLTLEENVAFGLDFRHQPRLARTEQRARVDAAIAEVGLKDARRAYPAALSGGMKQRAALARAIARQPELLLLDEPFSALDEITRGEMQALLRDVTGRHHTAAVLVTHDIDEALVVANRIVVIGGCPARLMDDWRITLPHPRDEAGAELARVRTEIVRSMRRARSGIAGACRLAA
ncbi:MAG: ABC transporter ATP-binding protein [Rhodanobacteraceae bacterium]